MMLLHRTCALTAAIMLGAVIVNGRSAEEFVSVPLPGSSPNLNTAYGMRPLAFEPNVGQTDAEVKFIARGKGYQLFLTQKEAVMVLQPPMADESAERLGVQQPSAAMWDGFGFCENRGFSELSNTFQSGAGASSLPVKMGLMFFISVTCNPHGARVGWIDAIYYFPPLHEGIEYQ